LAVPWYGLGYAIGLIAVYLLITHEARRRGLDARLVDTGIIIVAVAALIGGRLYHVIDQWQLYQNDLIKIVMPPYSGLGVYGGIITGTIAAIWYARRHHQPYGVWADVIAPGLFLMQGIARWGNFFNQELYGGPTTLPWGIAIDCAHRIAAYPCSQFPVETTFFHPLFLYESISGFLGCAFLLWLSRRHESRLVPGDLLLIFFIWYGTVRFVLEYFRSDNWTFFGVPTAQIVSVLMIVIAAGILVWRHGPGRPSAEPTPAEATPEDTTDVPAAVGEGRDGPEGAEGGATRAEEGSVGRSGEPGASGDRTDGLPRPT
jgi:phosphatidylglycerol:prolipoprotein diacylglycerol transferase